MSAASQPVQHYTISDLGKPEFDDMRLEIWEGELHEMPPAAYFHNVVAMRLLLLFVQFAARAAGVRPLPPGTGCKIADDTMLIPDAGLHRVPEGQQGRLLEDSPALAVEVISPTNNLREMERKRALYFAGGAEQVWIVDPRTKTVEVFLNNGSRLLLRDGVLHGEGVAEGLEVGLAELFAELS